MIQRETNSGGLGSGPETIRLLPYPVGPFHIRKVSGGAGFMSFARRAPLLGTPVLGTYLGPELERVPMEEAWRAGNRSTSASH